VETQKYTKRPLGSAKARADHNYYLRNQERLKERAKERYAAVRQARLEEAKKALLESTPVIENEPPKSSKLSQWIQRLTAIGKQSSLNVEKP